jgi:ParB family transcriptional regulator, chromosome partitioning protein
MTTKTKLIELDPNTVTVDTNVRRDLGDLRGLTRSVKELGVLEPAVVVADDNGGHTLLFGHRRRAAAIAAERPLPCIVASDVDDAQRIARQLAENLHRKDLTTGEEAAAYAQLAMLDMSDTAIARATGVTRAHVAKARKVADSDVAATVADRYHLTLDQAVTIAEFEDDRDAVKQLTVTARTNPGQFAHVASRLRQDRERAAQYAATVETLTAAGVTILDRYGDRGKAKPLGDLTDRDDGRPITPDEHAECPGRAAVVPDFDPTEPRHYCLDPAGHGHRDRYSRSGRTTPAALPDEVKAERREVIENNKAWRAAEPVRREWVRGLLSRKTAPKGTLRYVTEEIVGRPDRVGDGKEGLVAELLGVDTPTGYGRSVGAAHVTKVSDAQLPLALLAQVAADREQAMGVHTWRQRSTDAARWLAFLATTGYVLSDIEQHVVDEAAAEPTSDAGDDPEEGEAA